MLTLHAVFWLSCHAWPLSILFTTQSTKRSERFARRLVCTGPPPLTLYPMQVVKWQAEVQPKLGITCSMPYNCLDGFNFRQCDSYCDCTSQRAVPRGRCMRDTSATAQLQHGVADRTMASCGKLCHILCSSAVSRSFMPCSWHQSLLILLDRMSARNSVPVEKGTHSSGEETHLRVRKAAHISMAPQKETSPSPWLKCMSPILKLAPSMKTGKYTCHAPHHLCLSGTTCIQCRYHLCGQFNNEQDRPVET